MNSVRASRTHVPDSAPELVSDLAAAAELNSGDASPQLFPPPILKTSNAPPFSASSNKSKATRPSPDACLGISRATLYRKLKRYNIIRCSKFSVCGLAREFLGPLQKSTLRNLRVPKQFCQLLELISY
jgi:hypothetical protein